MKHALSDFVSLFLANILCCRSYGPELVKSLDMPAMLNLRARYSSVCTFISDLCF